MSKYDTVTEAEVDNLIDAVIASEDVFTDREILVLTRALEEYKKDINAS